MGAISTQDMVADCKQRVPVRVSATFWIDRLNEAYKWICQQGAFPWTIYRETISVGADGTFSLPGGWSLGRPSYIWKNGLMIPQKSWEEALKHSVYSSETDSAGNYSCWSYKINLSNAPTAYTYTGQMFPENSYPSIPDTTPEIVYHNMNIIVLSESATVYFPTPIEFDELIEALAESEARRRYGLAGWEKIQLRAQTGIQNLLKTYMTDKHTQFGLENQARHAQESQASKAV